MQTVEANAADRALICFHFMYLSLRDEPQSDGMRQIDCSTFQTNARSPSFGVARSISWSRCNIPSTWSSLTNVMMALAIEGHA